MLVDISAEKRALWRPALALHSVDAGMKVEASVALTQPTSSPSATALPGVRETPRGSLIPADPFNAPDLIISADFFLAHRIYSAPMGRVRELAAKGYWTQFERAVPRTGAARFSRPR